MVRVLAVAILLMLSLNIAVPVIMAEENVFYCVAFIGPSVVDDVKVYLVGGDEVYVRIVLRI
ncbi:MAG: hypothetical protein QW803_00975 [Candidatus Methanomethylicia archaeon]